MQRLYLKSSSGVGTAVNVGVRNVHIPVKLEAYDIHDIVRVCKVYATFG